VSSPAVIEHGLPEKDISAERVRPAVLWPREHGAWGLLSAPLVLGTIVALRSGRSDWLAWAVMVAAAFTFFLLRTPLEARVGRGLIRVASAEEKRAASRRIALLATLAGAAGLGVLYLLPVVPILVAGAVAAVVYTAQSFIPKRSAQLLAAVTMALGAPLAYLALGGRDFVVGMLLLAAAAAIAIDQTSYIHLQVSALRESSWRARFRAGWAFLLFQIVLTAGLVGAVSHYRLLTPIAAFAGTPLLLRGFWFFSRNHHRTSFRRLGFTELAYSAIAVLGIAAGVRL
jgi:hypothetical protein